jgi:stage IV sporulation protein FB
MRRKLKISPTSIIWIAFLIKFQSNIVIPLAFAIALHEAGHLIIARLLKIEIKEMRISILGARIETKNELSYTDEFLFASGGPFFGFLGFALTFPYSSQNLNIDFVRNFLLPFSLICLCLTIFNLIPLLSLDGGRMLFCILCKAVSLSFALKIIRLSSFFILFSFWIFSVYLLLKISAGLSMLVFCSIFFIKCFVLSSKNGDFVTF